MSKFYAVAKGRTVGIFNNWSECEKQVKGFVGAKYRKFDTKLEAQAFIKNPTFKNSNTSIQTNKRKYSTMINDENPEKMSKNFNFNSKQVKFENNDIDLTIVYTDGSCLGNGKKGSVGGIGVFFGENDTRNLSEKLDDDKFKATNQRAELMAAIRALEIVKDEENIEIRTDSVYTIKCATEWSKKWIVNDWKTSANKSVENRDLIETLLSLIKNRKGTVRFQHVEGHKGNYGNEQADELAVKGSNL